MEEIKLEASNREILGKKVRFLRRKGIIPAHLFGHGIESIALQCNAAELEGVLAQAGQSRLLSLKVSKVNEPKNVIVREIQKDPQTGRLLHVDFYQVSMAEEIKLEVPIVLVGKAPALEVKENMLLQELESLTIECLPDRIPARIDLNLSSLTEVEQAIHVKDITLGEEIRVLNDPAQLVVKISLRPVEKVEEAVVEEVVKAPEAVPPPESEPKKE